MKLFACQQCGNPIHFDNTVCVACSSRLGYIPDRFTLSAVQPEGDALRALADPRRRFTFCANAAHDACNWLVPLPDAPTPAAPGLLCAACDHNRTVPDLTRADNLAPWRKLETAKRHLFYSLLRLDLPHPTLEQDPQRGLAFDFLADTPGPDGQLQHVITGHAQGVITINLAEADDAEREKRRTQMREPYRTLLGHFRHEVGHYYFERLVADAHRLGDSRALFGDDSWDYPAALQRYYRDGPPADWPNFAISPYATAHPWEDFAETFAHYLHLVDALETAHAFGLSTRPRVRVAADLETQVDFDPYHAASVHDLADAWVPLTVAVNAVNRSMGQPDLYPFVLNQPVLAKLQFIHERIHERPR